MTGIDEVWAIIKLRNKIENDDNQLVANTYIEQVGVAIMDYCNISEIPKRLYFLWADMVSKLLMYDVPNLIPELGENSSSNSGMSIKVGDTSIGESSGSSTGGGQMFGSLTEESLQTLLTNYIAQLNHYRRLRWC